MQTQEIARDEWLTFFDSFNQQNQGGNITLEEFDNQSGAHMVTWDLAFEGITVNLRYKNEDTVTIIVSEHSKRRVNYVILVPSDIKLKQSDDGGINILQIKSTSGVITSVHFPTIQLSEEMFQNLLISRRVATYQQKKVQVEQM